MNQFKIKNMKIVLYLMILFEKNFIQQHKLAGVALTLCSMFDEADNEKLLHLSHCNIPKILLFFYKRTRNE